MSNFGEKEKEKGQRIMGPLDGTAVTEETEGVWCSKGMMSLEFTGHVRVMKWSAGSAALTLRLVPLGSTRMLGVNYEAGFFLVGCRPASVPMLTVMLV